jgi:NADH-quinone oxidoreductase subunit N
MKALVFISCLSVFILAAEIFRFRKIIFLPAVLLGLAATVVLEASEYGFNNTYYGMMRVDAYAIAFTTVILMTGMLWFIMLREDSSHAVANKTDHYSLVLFALTGAMVMVSYRSMVMLFLGIEILSLSLYVLAGSRKNDLRSNEAALKYFLMGAFATGFLLFGMALIYGVTASFDLEAIAGQLASGNIAAVRGLLVSGIIMLLAGLAFKVAAVPFHFWVPDVYEGSPTGITAFMATVVKTAAFAAFFKLFAVCFSAWKESWSSVVWMLALLTITIPNIIAVFQNHVKRMLAYSSISHAGYMLLALLAMNEISGKSILYYAAAYSVATITAFAILSIMERQEMGNAITFDSFNGLSTKHPVLALVMLISMLSLSGIPPLAGFFAKYYIFLAAVQEGYIGLVVMAVLGSLVGVYYYFRVIIAMYFRKAEQPASFIVERDIRIFFAITVLLTLAIGIFPEAVTRWL